MRAALPTEVKTRDQYAEEFGADLLFMDPPETYDSCILGVVLRCGTEPVVVYDTRAVVDKLIEQGMSHEEALEWFEFNVIGSWMGEKTPFYLFRLREEE